MLEVGLPVSSVATVRLRLGEQCCCRMVAGWQ